MAPPQRIRRAFGQRPVERTDVIPSIYIQSKTPEQERIESIISKDMQEKYNSTHKEEIEEQKAKESLNNSRLELNKESNQENAEKAEEYLDKGDFFSFFPYLYYKAKSKPWLLGAPEEGDTFTNTGTPLITNSPLKFSTLLTSLGGSYLGGELGERYLGGESGREVGATAGMFLTPGVYNKATRLRNAFWDDYYNTRARRFGTPYNTQQIESNPLSLSSTPEIKSIEYTPSQRVNYGSVIPQSSTLSTSESPVILKGFNNHLQGEDAVKMFKEYGSDYPVRLYRIQPSNKEALTGSVPEEGREKYVGMWFTPNAEKPALYGHQARQGRGKTASDPLDLQYVDIPASKLEQYKASNIVTEPIEYEPFEDYLIPLDYPRQTVSVPEGKLIQISRWLRENNLPQSQLMSELMKYVPEARERYGLIGNTNITDEEIAQALYKQAMELGEGTAATYPSGEPRLLFRADSRPYTQLRSKTPLETFEEAQTIGTMDNMLGINFLDDIVKSGERVDEGVLRYLNTYNKQTTSSPSAPHIPAMENPEGLPELPEGRSWSPYRIEPNISTTASKKLKLPKLEEIPDNYPLVGVRDMTYKGDPMAHIEYYKVPNSEMPEGYVNDINAFVVRTPSVRDMTKEMQTLAETDAVEDNQYMDWFTSEIPFMTYSKEGYPIINYKGKQIDASLGGIENAKELWWDQYNGILNAAKENNQGLLMSLPSGRRREHMKYTYFTLPNFNIGGAKHLLPYDLRRPRNWGSKNIYLSMTDPFNFNSLYKQIQKTSAQESYEGLRQGEEEVLNYLGSDKHIQRIMESDVSKEEATKIAQEMQDNALTAEGFIDYPLSTGRGGIVLGEYTSDLGSLPYSYRYPSKFTFKPKYNIRPFLGKDWTRREVHHEYGGHGATLGYDPNMWSEDPKIQQIYENVMSKWSPHYKQIYKHNSSLKPERLPEYQDISDEKTRKFIEYLEQTDEYSARARAENIEAGNDDFNELYKYFTKESVDRLRDNVWMFLPLTLGTGLYLNSDKQGGKLIPKAKSGIHIKKKNRGKFTEYCGGTVTDACIQKAKHSSNPTLRKRAIFAESSRKWNHKKKK